MASTWVTPTLEQRRAERAARLAFFAQIVKEYERLFAGVPFELRDWHVVSMCNGCGMNTGSWCDACEAQGRTFVTHWGQTMAGSSLCSRCEDEIVCPICGA